MAGSNATVAVGGDSSMHEPIPRWIFTDGTRSRSGSRAGRIVDPRSFVFSSYWYQGAHLAYALGGKQPVVCYSADDPRGFAFWSRPEDWVGREGVLVVIGEIEVWPGISGGGLPSRARRGFWGDRNGKPVRAELYRCGRKRVAFPFATDPAQNWPKSWPSVNGLGVRSDDQRSKLP